MDSTAIEAIVKPTPNVVAVLLSPGYVGEGGLAKKRFNRLLTGLCVKICDEHQLLMMLRWKYKQVTVAPAAISAIKTLIFPA